MWELNDANIANTYETNGFCMPDYAQSTQWDFDSGYANHSEDEINLATVLMNLKEEYPDQNSCSADHNDHGHDTIGNGYHATSAANCDDDERLHHQQQQHHHHLQQQHNHHQQQQHNHHQQQQHHHHHHHQQQQHQWHSTQSDEQTGGGGGGPLQRDDFVQYDSLDGSTNDNYAVHSSTDDHYLLPTVLDVDEEYCKVNAVIKKKRAGRPRGAKVKRSKAEPKLSRIWEFIRDLLLDSQYCPTYICWENYEEGRFRFVQSDKVAKLWGKFKRNDRMNYEKFSRAMRYYYKTGVLLPVQGKRLVYKFGPKATGWHTDNPNFKYAF